MSRLMNMMNQITKASVAALAALLTGCSPMAPIDIDPSRLAYAVLDASGNPSVLCFDTISPNNCITGQHDSLLKRLNPKNRILLQKYILVVGQPTQVDCKIKHPNECRVYFEHIHVDIAIDPKELDMLKKQLEQINI
jgi:hypothetical protein